MSAFGLKGQFDNFSGIGRDQFPNPFIDIGTLSMPGNFRNALYWAEYIMSIFGEYRMAMRRVVSYFLTDLQFDNCSDDEQDKWKKLNRDVLKTKSSLGNALMNRLTYGNDFSSLLVPFQRWLQCPAKQGNRRCGAAFPLKVVHDKESGFNFEFRLPDFIATCPKCGQRGKWIIDDRDDDVESKLSIKTWNPHEMEILHDPYSHQTAYLWRIPEDYKQKVKEGHLYYLERVPKGVLEAIQHNKRFRFHDDAIFHMKEPTLGGIYNRGWGLPRVLCDFRQIYYVQVLRRFNEAIALDYVVPWRIITPAPMGGKSGGGGGGGMNPFLAFNGSDMKGLINQMISRRRRDPCSVQSLPFPVEFQMFGADAKQLAPVELYEQGMSQLLNAAGVPIELYNGTLQLQAAPVALRLMESTWCSLVEEANMWLQWLVRQCSQVLSWETVDASLKRVTIADNLEQQMLEAQLGMSQQMSMSSILSNLGRDWKKEQKTIADEARFTAELQSRTQEEMAQAGFAQQMARGQAGQGDPSQGGGAGGGAAPAGGAGGGGGMVDPSTGQPMQGPVSSYLASIGPDTPVTLNDIMQTADTLASELLGLPESVKDSELRKLSTQNSVLHGEVRKRMDKQRQQQRLQAGAMQAGS